MRVLLMHKSTPGIEAGEMPTPELIARVGGMIGEMTAAGVLRDGTGLRQSALGVRLDFRGGLRTITPGPFTPANELTAALCVVKTRDLNEAVEWASRFAAILGDCQIDIRPVTEPWDLGMAARPAGQQFTRYMLVAKADKRHESGAAPAPEAVSGIAQLIEVMTAAGVYQSAELLKPSRSARRMQFKGGRSTVLDGPFTETKELISGFVLLEVPGLEEAAAWAPVYAAAVGDIELDIVPLYESADFR